MHITLLHFMQFRIFQFSVHAFPYFLFFNYFKIIKLRNKYLEYCFSLDKNYSNNTQLQCAVEHDAWYTQSRGVRSMLRLMRSFHKEPWLTECRRRTIFKQDFPPRYIDRIFTALTQ